ncbi:unnamed protein product [Mesocestoides corti]|uniref:E3 ubiquitin-protein ligase RNF170 n=1 Tax=Mesocestoides corti TaxID=53468 RepID=A0A0R3UNK5_MESCO|nr:unnamed protein product [Mesocestoides corti]
MEVIPGLDNSISLTLAMSGILIAVFVQAVIHRLVQCSRTPQIHPDNEQAVNEVRQSRAPRNSSSADATTPDGARAPDVCPICLEGITFGIETNCRHQFCGSCFCAYWQHTSPLAQPNCPVCRGQLRFLVKCFTPEEIQADATQERSDVESQIALFNRRYSGNPVSFLDQLRDLPALMRYGVRALLDGDGISCLLRLRLIVLSLFVFFYVVSPLDIFPESVVGAFGLLDDCLVCVVFFIYMAALFRGRLAANS